jgi:hypothetical protein
LVRTSASSCTQTNNELERRFSSLPGLAQEALREPFTWMNNALRQVAGEPQVPLVAGSRYVEAAETVQEQGPGKVVDCPDWTVLGQARRAG